MRIIILLLICTSTQLIAQPLWAVKDKFDIASWEIEKSREEKIAIIQKANLHTITDLLEGTETPLANEIDNFHFGYFDSDKIIDIIYTSSLGSESTFSHIYVNNESSFKHIITVGTITELFYDQKSTLPTIKSILPPCCADYIYTLTVDIPKSNDTYQAGITYYYDEGMEFPSELTLNQKFEVTKDTYRLRRTPEIDNTVDKYLDDAPVGNISHSYSNGDKGCAYASKTDSTGRVWWFVEMENPTLKTGEHFPNTGTFYLGWMSSTYVKKI